MGYLKVIGLGKASLIEHWSPTMRAVFLLALDDETVPAAPRVKRDAKTIHTLPYCPEGEEIVGTAFQILVQTYADLTDSSCPAGLTEDACEEHIHTFRACIVNFFSVANNMNNGDFSLT